MLVTTAIFVDLLVIGVGVTGAAVLLTLALLGTGWVEDLDLNLNLAVILPMVAVTYVLGIVMDRIADSIFDPRDQSLRNEYMEGLDYHAARLHAYEAESIVSLLEYNRSRTRVCRGWILNWGLLAGSSNLFIWMQLSAYEGRLPLALSVTPVLGGLSYSCWWSWNKLVVTFYEQIAASTRSPSGSDERS